MPRTTIVESSPTEPAQRLAEGRRARSGYLFAFHIVLLGAAGRTPTEMAAFLLCARSRLPQHRRLIVSSAGSSGPLAI